MENRCIAFMNDLNEKDLTLLAAWFDETSEVWIPPAPPIKGNTRILALFRAIFRKYESLNWKIVEVHELTACRCFFISESWGTRNDRPYKNFVATDITFNKEGHIDKLSDYFKETFASA